MNDVVAKERRFAAIRISKGLEGASRAQGMEGARMLAPILARAKALVESGNLHKAAFEIDCAARASFEPGKKAELFRIAGDAYLAGGDSRGEVHGELCMQSAARWAELEPAKGKGNGKNGDSGMRG